MSNGTGAAAGERGTLPFERGTGTAPYRTNSSPDSTDRGGDADDGVREAEQIIQDDADLYEAYTRLVNDRWRLSRLALPTSYRVNRELKTIVLDDHLALDRILTVTREAVRKVYLSAPGLRRMAILDRAMALLNRRALVSPTLTDLEIMAQVYDWAAWPYPAAAGVGLEEINQQYVRDIFADLLRVLSGQRSQGMRADIQNRGFVDDATYFVGNRFRSTGFKREFRDTSNQVRHTTASITVNIIFGTYQGKRAAQNREEPGVDFADIRLNEACADIAKTFLYEDLSDASTFGNIIRTELGDPNETAPWPSNLEHGIPD